MKARNIAEKIAVPAAAITTVWALGGCASAQFTDNPGDILAGYPATVESKQYTGQQTGEDGPYGHTLFLRTEDCPEGVQPAPGLGNFGNSCIEKNHPVDMKTFLAFSDGSGIVWNRSKSASFVEQHRHGWDYYYVTNYALALLVTQCIRQSGDGDAPAHCVTDSVPVGFDTWMDATVGQTIYFAGEQGKVVSQ